jgi:hypothetical protein
MRATTLKEAKKCVFLFHWQKDVRLFVPLAKRVTTFCSIGKNMYGFLYIGKKRYDFLFHWQKEVQRCVPLEEGGRVFVPRY